MPENAVIRVEKRCFLLCISLFAVGMGVFPCGGQQAVTGGKTAENNTFQNHRKEVRKWRYFA